VNNFLASSSIVKLSRSLPIVYLVLFRQRTSPPVLCRTSATTSKYGHCYHQNRYDCGANYHNSSLLALFPCRQLPELTVEHEEPGTVSEISDRAAQFHQDARQSAVQFLLGRLPLGLIEERQRLAAYFHNQWARDLMALAFSIEGIRSELESEKHPAETKLNEIRDRVSKMLQPICENILNLVEDRPNRSSGRQYSALRVQTAVQNIQIELQRKADFTPAGQYHRPGV
jgi:signal transduction histidine kinase